jgi:hypothetical protein
MSTLCVYHNHVNDYTEASKTSNMSLHPFILLDIDTYRLITSKNGNNVGICPCVTTLNA